MKKTNVAIIGMGFLGKLMKEFFEKRSDLFEVEGYDIDPRLWCGEIINNLPRNWNIHSGIDHGISSPEELELLKKELDNKKRQRINKCQWAFICVPTPSKDDDRCDTSIVEECVDWLETEFIVIRSTVEPGTTRRLQMDNLNPTPFATPSTWKLYNKQLLFWPEFGGESKYQSPYAFDQDMSVMPWFIFGAHEKSWSKDLLQLVLPIAGPMTRYHITDSTTAEMAKYTTNTFAAMKIAYCNEIYEICDKLGISYEDVREMWANSDPRVSLMHTAVFRDNRGYGGKCFPKDVKALASWSQNELGIPSGVICAVDLSNEKMRRKNEED